jgi:peroxiredoxin
MASHLSFSDSGWLRMMLPNWFSSRFDLNIPIWLIVLRFVYGTIFLFSGALKILDVFSFANSLNAFRILPPALVSSVAIVIPIIEIVLGASIICGFRTALMSALTAFMLALFTGVVAEKLIEGARISCGCFGPLSGDDLTEMTLVRNIILCLCGALLSTFSTFIQWQSKPPQCRPIGAPTKASSWFAPTILGPVQRGAALTAISLVLALFSLLTLQNRELKIRLAMVVDKQVLRPGEIVPAFSAIYLNNEQCQIQYQGGIAKTLLFVFSTKCDACRKNLPHWADIVRMVQQRKDCRVIGVSLNELDNSRKFVESHSITFPIVVPSDSVFPREYKVSATPQTILVDSTGLVQNIWTGVLDSLKDTEVLQALRGNPNLGKFL